MPTMAYTKKYIFNIVVFGILAAEIVSAKTCPGFPGYCSESFPGQTCIVVCSRGRPNVPLCQEDGTWTDIPRCVEHDPGVDEQVPGLCPGIPGYCSEAYLGQACNFDCSFGPDIRSTCGPDGTWEPYPTCQGDLRETQDGCNGCPGSNGRFRNRTAEAILGIEPVNPARPQDHQDRKVRPSFAGNVAFGPTQVTTPRPAPRTTPRPAPPRTTARPSFVPNLVTAGLRTTASPRQQQQPRIPQQQQPRRFDPRIPAQNQIPQTKASFPQQQPRIPQQQQPRIPQQQQSIFNQQQPRPAQNPRVSQLPQQQFAQNPRFPQQQNVQNPRLPQQAAQAPRQGSGGFSQRQLSIIRSGISRLNGFGGFGSQQTQQQQPRVPQQQQPRVPQQQQPLIPQQQQPRIAPQQQQPRTPPQQQQPRVAPQPQQQPRQPPPAQGAQPKTTQLTALQKAILKNAGVTKIPDQIEKVEKVDPSQPRFVNNLFAEENTSPRPVSVSPINDD